MRNRAIQLVVVGLVGAFLAWLLTREDDTEPAPVRAAIERPVPPPPPEPSKAAPTGEPDPQVTFRLPKLASAASDAIAPPPPRPKTIQIPKDWQLRGSGSRNYELRSDGDSVFTGNHSAVIFSHDKEVQPNLSGSGVQSVFAGRYVGTRVELSAMLRSEDVRGGGAIWMYVTDPGRVVIGYQIAQMTGNDAGEWTRYRVVMDVPWHAELLAYGFTLQGRGRLWVDDMHLTPVDINVPLTGPQNSYQLGVIAQAVSTDGALTNPTNMDFEDMQVTRERQPDAPPDQINGTRF